MPTCETSVEQTLILRFIIHMKFIPMQRRVYQAMLEYDSVSFALQKGGVHLNKQDIRQWTHVSEILAYSNFEATFI